MPSRANARSIATLSVKVSCAVSGRGDAQSAMAIVVDASRILSLGMNTSA
jgi:hypothetical protein